MKEKYIILELIPEAISPDKGSVVQISALKIDKYNLIDRFDYRLKENKIKNKDVLRLISYDSDNFKYADKNILDIFEKWSEDLKILIIDNEYTLNFLNNIPNEKESIFKYLNLKFSENVIDELINKYNLEPSNYIVDLLYESLIYESNNK